MYCNGGDKWKLKEKIKKYYNMPGRPVSPLIVAAHVLQAFCAPLGSAALKASRKRKRKRTTINLLTLLHLFESSGKRKRSVSTNLTNSMTSRTAYQCISAVQEFHCQNNITIF